MKAQVSAIGSDKELAKLTETIKEVSEALDNVKIRLQAIQLSSEENIHDNTNAITALKKTVGELKERISEVLQTINGVSKISDSVFDLKNAQINMKKSIDSLETSVKGLKKKLNASVVMLSIIGILIVALQIIAILS